MALVVGRAEPRDPRPTANQYRHLSEAVCYKDGALWTPLVGDTLRGVPRADWLVNKLKRRPGDLGCNDVISCGKLGTVGDARRRCMPRLLTVGDARRRCMPRLLTVGDARRRCMPRLLTVGDARRRCMPRLLTEETVHAAPVDCSVGRLPALVPRVSEVKLTTTLLRQCGIMQAWVLCYKES